jgi:dihydroorotase-like cyclic amidohydrolase
LIDRFIREGDILASDHAPHRLEDRVVGMWEYGRAPSGLATNQYMLVTAATLLTERLGQERGLVRLAELSAATPARRFGLTDRGELSLGKAASLVVLEETSTAVNGRLLESRIQHTALEGIPVRYSVQRTVMHGRTMYTRDDGVAGSAWGKLLRWPRT